VTIEKIIIGGENEDWLIEKDIYQSSVGDYN
jgi:hypothetical protein